MLYPADRIAYLLAKRGPVPLRDVIEPPYLVWDVGEINPEDFILIGQKLWHVFMNQNAVVGELAQQGVRNSRSFVEPEELVIIDEMWGSATVADASSVTLQNIYEAGWNPAGAFARDSQFAPTIDALAINIGGCTAQGRERSSAAMDVNAVAMPDTNTLTIPTSAVQLPIKGVVLRNNWQLSIVAGTLNNTHKLIVLGRELRLQPR